MFIIVDLPEPEGPMMEMNSPFRQLNETLSRAASFTEPTSYVLLVFSSSIIFMNPILLLLHTTLAC